MKKKLLKLDLSYGDVPAGHPFKRVGAVKPMKFPWPLASQSVEEAFSAHLFNRIPASLRGKFMDELWRVLMPEGKVTIIVPYWSSPRSVQDPTVEWPPLVEQSFLYFNKQWRQDNKVASDMKCDFDFVYGYTFDPETQVKTDDLRAFAVKHYLNAAHDLQVVLTKRK